MTVAGSFEIVLGSADEWSSDDSADIERCEQFSALLAQAVELFEPEMLFMAGKLSKDVIIFVSARPGFQSATTWLFRFRPLADIPGHMS